MITNGGSGGGWSKELSGVTFESQAQKDAYYGAEGALDHGIGVSHMNGASSFNSWVGGYACVTKMSNGDAYGGFGGGGAACEAGGGGGGFIGGENFQNFYTYTPFLLPLFYKQSASKSGFFQRLCGNGRQQELLENLVLSLRI